MATFADSRARRVQSGYFASWGGSWNVRGRRGAYPSQGDGGGRVLGAYGGVGVNLFLTNADSMRDFASVGDAVNLGGGWVQRVGAVQFVRGGGTWTLSVGTPPLPGAGFGGAASSYKTNTVGCGWDKLAPYRWLGRQARRGWAWARRRFGL